MKLCSVPGCDRAHSSKGLCGMHYNRQVRNRPLDSPVQPKSKYTPAGEPIDFIETQVLTTTSDECILWPYGRGTGGYGSLKSPQGNMIVASRYVCIRAHGAPPTEEHQASFTCHNGHNGCVNPRHLKWLTETENIESRVAEGRTAKGPQMPHAKLDEQKVRQIRRMYPDTSYERLAKIFSVTPTTIANVVQRKKWAWVPD